MTIYHTHHIVPRHMGGTDDPSNLIELTIEEHALAHKALWEEHGSEYDHIAWRCLSGLITGEEARIEAVKVALKGVSKPIEQKEKMSESAKERWQRKGQKEKLSKKMKGNDYGKANKGRTYSCESLNKMSVAKKGRRQRICSCVICQKEISVSNVEQHYRWRHKKAGD